MTIPVGETELPYANIWLTPGIHRARAGMSLTELVARLAGEPHTHQPACMDPCLTSFARLINDGLTGSTRQLLAPLAPTMIGTRGDGLARVRVAAVRRWMWQVNVRTWLALADATNPDAPPLALMVSGHAPPHSYRDTVLTDLADRVTNARHNLHAAIRYTRMQGATERDTHRAYTDASTYARLLAAQTVLQRTRLDHPGHLDHVLPAVITKVTTTKAIYTYTDDPVHKPLADVFRVTLTTTHDYLEHTLIDLLTEMVKPSADSFLAEWIDMPLPEPLPENGDTLTI